MDGTIKKVLEIIEKTNPHIIAIDGRCGSGKTTLANELSKHYDLNVFHMDDYFIPIKNRTNDRLVNVDYERFLNEVLLPLSRNEEVIFRRFNCKTQTLLEPQIIKPKKLNIVEGTYSLCPSLISYYDLKIFSDISKEEQRKRLKERSNFEDFISTWIPFEEKYFDELKIRDKADLIL